MYERCLCSLGNSTTSASTATTSDAGKKGKAGKARYVVEHRLSSRLLVAMVKQYFLGST